MIATVNEMMVVGRGTYDVEYNDAEGKETYVVFGDISSQMPNLKDLEGKDKSSLSEIKARVTERVSEMYERFIDVKNKWAVTYKQYQYFPVTTEARKLSNNLNLIKGIVIVVSVVLDLFIVNLGIFIANEKEKSDARRAAENRLTEQFPTDFFIHDRSMYGMVNGYPEMNGGQAAHIGPMLLRDERFKNVTELCDLSEKNSKRWDQHKNLFITVA